VKTLLKQRRQKGDQGDDIEDSFPVGFYSKPWASSNGGERKKASPRKYPYPGFSNAFREGFMDH